MLDIEQPKEDEQGCKNQNPSKTIQFTKSASSSRADLNQPTIFTTT